MLKSPIFYKTLAVIIILPTVFWAGMKYQEIATRNKNQQQVQERIKDVKVAGAEIRIGNLVMNGKIKTITDSTIELEDKDGKTQKYDFTNETRITSQASEEITKADLKNGVNVVIYGKINPDKNGNPLINRMKIITTSP